MPEIAGRDFDAGGAAGLGNQRVDGKGILGKHHAVARAQEGPGNQFQQVIGAVAQHDLLRYRAKAAADGRFYVKTVAIRVAGNVVQCCDQCRLDPGGQTLRVFIRGKLDDTGRIEVQLTGQLTDRFAWLVGGDGPDMGRGKAGQV